MTCFRDFLRRLENDGAVLRVTRPVHPRFELAALLEQAEAREKVIIFEAVKGSTIPVVGALLTSTERFALALGLPQPEQFSRDAHAMRLAQAMAEPLATVTVTEAACQEIVQSGSNVNCGALPVPTFFSGDSGPFLTAAVGLCRNPANGVINAGYYRVLMTGPAEVAVSVGPSSDLLGFLQADAAAGRTTRMALVIGGDPALLMAAASRTPAERSELDVAGALAGKPLRVVAARTSDLLVPADSEIVIEVRIDHQQPRLPNTMGEFGDLYGTQNAFLATVETITHREQPLFHVIRAGAGREHNSIGFIVLYGVQGDLQRYLQDTHPEVSGVRVRFDPPAMGPAGEIYVQLRSGERPSAQSLVRELFGMRCGGFDLARVIRRIVLVDEDIDIDNPRQINWAINNRALTADRYLCVDELPLPGLSVRLAIDATAAPELREKLRRLETPGANAVKLNDYLA